jgi:large subunit ribosomal protein L4
MTTKVLKVDLPAEIFDAKVNIPLMHQVVVAQQAAARQGTHATKTRGNVRGGGRKPYKQKGTGRARQGSIRAPQYAGGGIVHGPQPRSYDQRTPKKMKAAALRGALSDRARAGRIHVVDGLVEGGTEGAEVVEVKVAEPAKKATAKKAAADDDKPAKKAAAKKAPAKKAAAKIAEVVESAEPETADEVELPKGAKAPLKSGKAPKGYEIKGNADSGKYHAPGGQWYDATEAEFWFKSAEDAEAAGFVEAGSAESIEQTHAEEEGE